MFFGRTPGAMVDSHLIELLNPPPPRRHKYSWVKPGVAVWDWRIDGAQIPGFKSRDVAAFVEAHGGLRRRERHPSPRPDADWYGPEFGKESDPVKGGKVAQVRTIIAYGKGKNVGVWLYLNDVAGRQNPCSTRR